MAGESAAPQVEVMGYREWVPMQQQDGQNASAALRARMLVECWCSGAQLGMSITQGRRRDYLEDGGIGCQKELL